MKDYNATLNLRQSLSSDAVVSSIDVAESWLDDQLYDLGKSSLAELTKKELDDLKRSAMDQSKREELTCYKNAILIGLVALAAIPVIVGGSLVGFSALAYFLPEAAFIPTMLSGAAFSGLSLMQVKQKLTPLFQSSVRSHWDASKEYHSLAEDLQRKKVEPFQ